MGERSGLWRCGALLLVATGCSGSEETDTDAVSVTSSSDASGTTQGSGSGPGTTVGTSGQDTESTGSDPSSDETGTPPTSGVGARLFNVAMDRPDPRWEALPDALSTVQLSGTYTLEATVPVGVASVRLTLDGGDSVLDVEAPFRWTEDAQGNAAAMELAPGEYSLRVEGFSSDEASGAPAYSGDIAFELTTRGTNESPGAHAVHRIWQTADGTFVTRDAKGNFIDADGTVVFPAASVSEVEQGGEGQRHVLIDGSADAIVFAFMVALPDGFDAEVPYPLVVFLHHGWGVYRGTDNDGLPLDAPLFAGPRSLIAESDEHARFPAVVLIPQMRGVETVEGITHEWAAFSSITDGTSNSGPELSNNFVPVLEVIDRLETGELSVDAQRPRVDPHRVYVAGHSMGGLGSWDVLARMPDRWAAGVPMAGYADHARAVELSDTPIWAFHHENDCYNPASGTQAMLGLVTETHGGTRMRYTLQRFDTGGACDQAHFQTPNYAWNEEPGLFEWMFGQVNDRL
ncbi:MAG: hypothetical protein ACRBN8_00305 [Nannocystales bacterium]